MKIQTGMIFMNQYANQQVMVDREEYGMVHYCPINGGTRGYYVSKQSFLKYHSIYIGSIV